MPQAVGGAIFSAIGLSTTAGVTVLGTTITYASMAGYLVTTAITSWATSALAPKPDFSSLNSGGIMVNGVDPVAPHEFVYGEVRKGGVVTYFEDTGTNNKFHHRIITLAGHEVAEIGDIYIDGEVADWDANTGLVGGKWENKIRINKHLGDQTTADADLLSESNQIDGSFVGYDIAYLYARFASDQDVFANGIPTITAVVKGKKVYDPRTDTKAYSDNAVLCLRDYIDADYGLNDPDIDDVTAQAGANESDTDIPLAGGGTEKKYTMNGIVRADTPHGDVLNKMVTCCAGTLFWGMGNWKLVPGAYSAPVKNLTLDDLRGSISVNPRTNARDLFNTVRGTFNDSDQDWITVDYPQIASGTFRAEDGGEEQALDLELPFTTSAATAQRLAKLTLYRAREQIRMDADFSLNAFDVQVGDIITFSNERYGWTQKEFEVVGWQLKSAENGAPRVHLSLQETSEAAFDWNAEETAIIANNSTLLSVFDVPTPSLNAAVIGTTVNNDGTSVPQIRFSWSTSEEELVDQFDFQWKLSTDSDWNSTTIRTTEFYLAPAISGAAYDYRVRAVNGFGVKSPFASSASPASTGDDGTTPNAPSNVTASGGYASATVTWDAPTQNTDGSALKDLFQYKIYRGTSANPTTLVGRVSGEAFTESGLDDNQTYYYRVKALDFTGNESAYSADDSVTTNPQLVDGADGASVLVVYADDAGGSNQSLTANGREYVQYVEYTATAPSLPVSGTFVKFVGDKGVNGADGADGQSVHPIYADDSAGNGQSFDPTGKDFVTFFEATSSPTLPVSGQTFVPYVGADGADGSDGADGADGERGPGRWHVGVSTLPTTSSGAHTDFTNAIGAPVDLDQAWFYTGNLSNPTAQAVWIYEEGSGATPADSWNEQEEVIDGDLLVTGSVSAAQIAISDESAADRVEIVDNKILIYDNNVLRVKIGDLS